MRNGYGFAEGAALHGASPERHWVRESRRAWLWGLGLPLFAFVCAALFGLVGFAPLTAYLFQVVRLALRGDRSRRENWWRAGFLVLGKFPEMLGQARFLLHRHFGRQSRPIEHK